MTRDFIFERATKNTYRFAEVYDSSATETPFGVVIGVLYIQKAAFDKQPQRIRVTVEEVAA